MRPGRCTRSASPRDFSSICRLSAYDADAGPMMSSSKRGASVISDQAADAFDQLRDALHGLDLPEVDQAQRAVMASRLLRAAEWRRSRCH